jgi:UDP-glucose 4-epimerase
VDRALGPTSWQGCRAIDWKQPEAARRTLAEGLREFAAAVAARRCDSWRICWCAGAGIVGTTAAQLEPETEILRWFLDRLGAEARLMTTRGCLFLSSSAGGIYAGSRSRPIDETTASHPISDYGRAKLEQEGILSAWIAARPNVSLLLGRLANVYGTAQRLDKPQGLISHMSPCILYRSPLHIYVPLDTIRDYLYAEDAGRQVVAGLDTLMATRPGDARQVIRIFGAEREISIAGLIGTFFRITRSHVRVIQGAHPGRGQQPPLLQFRSRVWTDVIGPPRVNLLEGVSRVHRHNLALFQAGRLPPPAMLTRRSAPAPQERKAVKFVPVSPIRQPGQFLGVRR